MLFNLYFVYAVNASRCFRESNINRVEFQHVPQLHTIQQMRLSSLQKNRQK